MCKIIYSRDRICRNSFGEIQFAFGGDHEGNRLNKIYKESLEEPAILNELDGLFASFKNEKRRAKDLVIIHSGNC